MYAKYTHNVVYMRPLLLCLHSASEKDSTEKYHLLQIIRCRVIIMYLNTGNAL